MKKRFSDERIVAILREGQTGQKTVEQICREHSVSSNTYYTWKRRYGAMDEPDVRRLREPEKENTSGGSSSGCWPSGMWRST